MKNIYRLTAILSAAAVALTFSSCGQKSDTTISVTENAEVDTRPLGEMRGLTAYELVAEMGTGWNLGNTMDAEGGETAWGNPVTTKEMIDEIHNAGFDTLRIPTTWDGHMYDDFTVDTEWMDRVEEIVDYALEDDMYVILNTHHETKWIKPSYDELDGFKDNFASLWTQISERFADYGDHLVFEGLNEPRIVGGKNEWNGGTEETRDVINQLDRLFVDTVRATGGNNATRTLLITTVAAASCDTAIKNLVIPDDKYVGVSLHAYTPYRFTYDSVGESWNALEFDTSCASEIDDLFNSIDEHIVSKGIPVVITEYGAVSKIVDKDWYLYNDEDVRNWADHYLKSARSHGIPCVWWDNGIHRGSGELFGIFDRNELIWYDPELIRTIIEASE